MATRSGKKKGRIVSVDFTDVDTEGGSVYIPEGDYAVEVESVEEGVSKNDNEQLEWIFRGTEGKAKGKKFYYYTTLTPESLWKLARALMALGMETPDSPTDIDLDELVGRECIGVVIDDKYEGKTRSKLQELKPTEEGEERTDRRDTKSSRKGRNGSEAEKIDEKEVQQMAEDELSDLVKEHDLDIDLRDHKTLRRKATAVIGALDDKGLLA